MRERINALLGIKLVRFVISGGLNTLATYLLYLLMLEVLPYQASYAVAYLAGIVIGYCLNRFFVFSESNRAYAWLFYPLIYVVQYGLNAGLIYVCVEILHFSTVVAPLISTVVSIPIVFVLSKLVFVKRGGDVSQ